MLRCTTNLVDFGEFTGDNIGDDESRVEPHPDLQRRVAQAYDTPHQFDGCVAGKWRMIVVRDRSPKYRRQPVAHFLADDAAELTHRGSHGGQRRLKTQQGLLGFKLGNEVRRVDHVRAKDRHELSLAVGILGRGVPRIADRARAAMGAPEVAGVHRRLASETMHFCALIGTKVSNRNTRGRLRARV
jgi:hypothetical protein